MQTKREFSDDIFIQKQSFILESIKQNRNRVLFFLAFVLYVLLTVLGTTDRDFFFESGISFPLLNIKLPLIAFYVVVPIIIILVHFNVLYLYQEHQKLLQKHSIIKKFYSSMPLGIFDMPIITKGTIHTLIKIFTYLVIYIMPLLTLYILWWHFNKYQSSFYSSLHLLYIAIDTLLLSYFLFATKVGKILSALLWVGFIVATLLQMAINNEERALSIIYSNFPKLKKDTIKEFTKQHYPHLELSGEHLVSFDYNQLKSLQSLEKSKPLALLQPPLNLANRSFKYANFSHALLVRVNLRSANLQGANLGSANLQGANLWSANLQGANLRSTNLQRADLGYANLQGANLWSANLEGADLMGAELQGANLMGTELQGADLRFANLQGVQSCNIIRFNFTKRILQYSNRDSNLTCIYKRTLSKEGKEALTKELKEIYNKQYKQYKHYKRIKEAIERIQKSTSAMPDLSKAKIGSYTKEEAQKWIEEYKKATGAKP